MIPSPLYIHVKVYISEVMTKSIKQILTIFFIFQQLKSQISKIDQHGFNSFCDETLHLYSSSIF